MGFSFGIFHFLIQIHFFYPAPVWKVGTGNAPGGTGSSWKEKTDEGTSDDAAHGMGVPPFLLATCSVPAGHYYRFFAGNHELGSW